jgi:Spy/CpxP family protein refolding chaperone
MTDQSSVPSQRPTGINPTTRRRWPWIVAGALAVSLTGAVATHAWSEGFGHGRWGPPGFMGGMGGRLDPSQAEERADRMVRHLAIEIDATPQQQERLRAIVKAAVKDLFPLRDKARANRERAQTLLTQATVDRAAIEAFRVEQMALADTASKRIAQALADAAEVLTADQRRKIDEHLTARRNSWRFWHRG